MFTRPAAVRPSPSAVGAVADARGHVVRRHASRVSGAVRGDGAVGRAGEQTISGVGGSPERLQVMRVQISDDERNSLTMTVGG